MSSLPIIPTNHGVTEVSDALATLAADPPAVARRPATDVLAEDRRSRARLRGYHELPHAARSDSMSSSESTGTSAGFGDAARIEDAGREARVVQTHQDVAHGVLEADEEHLARSTNRRPSWTPVGGRPRRGPGRRSRRGSRWRDGDGAGGAASSGRAERLSPQGRRALPAGQAPMPVTLRTRRRKHSTMIQTRSHLQGLFPIYLHKEYSRRSGSSAANSLRVLLLLLLLSLQVAKVEGPA